MKVPVTSTSASAMGVTPSAAVTRPVTVPMAGDRGHRQRRAAGLALDRRYDVRLTDSNRRYGATRGVDRRDLLVAARPGRRASGEGEPVNVARDERGLTGAARDERTLASASRRPC